MLESKVQKAISKKLQDHGWLVLKIIQLSANGYPDLMCLKNGEAVFIEVKQAGLKPRELQEFRIEQLNKHGFKSFYVDNKDDVRITKMCKL